MKLWSFNLDCGRMGELESLFVANESDIESAIGKTVYFGEVLGKYSEIFFKLEKDMLKEVGGAILAIGLFVVFKSHNICGKNPLDYIEEE